MLGGSNLDLMRVAVQGYFQLSEDCGLNLICVLQLFDPVGLLAFETRYLALDLHALVVLFVNAAKELGSLLLTLNLCLHAAHLNAFFLLVANHLLHALGLQFLRVFLHLNHLLVLLALQLETLCLSEVFLGLLHLLLTDCLLLLGARQVVPVLQLAFLHGTLLDLSHFFILVLQVALAYSRDVVSLLLSLFNLFPGLQTQ